MKRFRSILVWIEDGPGAEVALDQAVFLARTSGATLTLAHAVEPPGRLLRALYAQADDIHSVLRREWEDRLDSLAHPLRDGGLEVSTRLLEGKPFLAFTREVMAAGHDLMVKPAEDPATSQLFGSTDLHLLRKCPSAIWITSGEARRSAGILALVDPDPEHEEISRRILQMASSLGQMRDAKVDVLHVWRLSGEHLLAKRVQVDELKSVVEAARGRSAEDLETLIASSGADVARDRVHLVKGDVRDIVPEFVDRNDIGLIVMGTLGRTGVRGVLIGNTAETVLSRVRCPVLTVKPHGFVSPVQPGGTTE